MDTSEDNTAVWNMKKSFDVFLGSASSQRATSRMVSTLNFGDSLCEEADETSRSSKKRTAASMQEIIEKEKEDRLKKAALVAANSRITQLNSQLENLETSRKRARFEYDKELETIKQNHKRESEKAADMKHQLRLMKTREVELQEELTQYRRTLSTTKAGYEEKLLSLQKQKHQSQTEWQEMERTNKAKISELKNSTIRQQTELKICQLELEDTKEQLAEALKRCMQSTQQMQESEESKLKAMRAEHRIKELELELVKMDEDAVIVKSMKSQLNRLQEAEKENRKLRDENKYLRETQENSFLLTEQVTGLQNKLERSEERCSEYTRLQMDYDDLKIKWQKSEGVNNKHLGRPTSPSESSRKVAELQTANVRLLEKQGQLQASLRVAEESLCVNEQKLQSALQDLQSKGTQFQQQQNIHKRLHRKLLLVTKERDGYKSIIDGYENEVTVNLAEATTGRIRHLEQMMEEYRQQMTYLETELNQSMEQSGIYMSKTQSLENQVSSQSTQKGFPAATSEADQKIILGLREQVAELEKKLEQVVEEKYVLEDRIERRHLQGDYDPATTKVVHLTMNPIAVAQRQRGEVLTQLRQENLELKERVKILEESGGSAADVTCRVEQRVEENTVSGVKEIKAQLTSAELKNKRLVEVFKKTSQEFREVVYQLLGYKIDLPTSNQYRLMNMFSESPSDFLLFQQSDEGELQLLATDYSSSLRENMDYLQSYHSIPAFLSSLTMDLFSRQTMLQ